MQVSNYLSFTRDDSDEEKRAELASVVAIGDVLFVKVTFPQTLDASLPSPSLGAHELNISHALSYLGLYAVKLTPSTHAGRRGG